MWNMEEALLFIRNLQPVVKKYNFHLALAGGVLNNGYSVKDLDIICMGMHNDLPNRTKDMISKFEVDYNAVLNTTEEYVMQGRLLYKMNLNGKVIDLFLYE